MRSDDDEPVRAAVRRFLASVESRDPAAVAACFTPDASYRNVPHEAATGPPAIEQLFRPILTRSERVVWDIVSEAYSPTRRGSSGSTASGSTAWGTRRVAGTAQRQRPPPSPVELTPAGTAVAIFFPPARGSPIATCREKSRFPCA